MHRSYGVRVVRSAGSAHAMGVSHVHGRSEIGKTRERTALDKRIGGQELCRGYQASEKGQKRRRLREQDVRSAKRRHTTERIELQPRCPRSVSGTTACGHRLVAFYACVEAIGSSAPRFVPTDRRTNF